MAFSLSDDEKKWLLKRAHHLLEAAAKGIVPDPPDEDALSENLLMQTGAFVSIYENGNLRGCVGHFGDDMPLWKVVDHMTFAAAMNDPRFVPLQPDDVDNVRVDISVLTPMRKIRDVSEIIPGKHGIMIEKEGRGGTFLPQVAEKTGWNREELLGHCARDKAGLGWEGWKEADIYIYEALVFGDTGTE